MSGITPEACADKVLPVDREALIAALEDCASIPLGVIDDGEERWVEYWADMLIASPVLRALAETVWNEGCVAGNNGALHPRGEYAPNPYREQAR